MMKRFFAVGVLALLAIVLLGTSEAFATVAPPPPSDEWVDTSVCTASVCDSTEGTKTQALYAEVCDKECPVVSFQASRMVCPDGYKEHNGECRKKVCGNWVYTPMIEEVFGPIDVQYGGRSNDPNKCHRPNVNDLDLPQWVRPIYNTKMAEHLPFVDVNCEMVIVDTRVVDCDDAIPFECEPTPDPTQPTPDPTQPTPDPTQPTPDPTQPTPQPTQPTPQPEPVIVSEVDTGSSILPLVGGGILATSVGAFFLLKKKK